VWTYVNNWWYTAKELGLPFPKATRIYIGACGSGVGIVGATGGSAHTHMDEKDAAMHHAICISSKEMLWNTDGTISQLAWHEYGHIESNISFTDEQIRLLNEEQAQVIAHGPIFIEAMSRLGHSEASGRYVQRW